MAFLTINDRVLAYSECGAVDAPAVLLAHPLGMSRSVWENICGSLAAEFRLVAWDLPGHGASAPAPAALSVEDLAADALALADALGVDRFHFVGTSIGGVLGQQLLLTAPARLGAVVLTNTAPVIGTADNWAARAAAVRADGLAAMAQQISARWFGTTFVQSSPAAAAGWTVQLARTDDESYARCCELLAGADFRDRLNNIESAVRLIAGEADVATPVSALQDLAGELGGVPVEVLPGVGHVPSVEAPEAMAEFLRESLRGAPL